MPIDFPATPEIGDVYTYNDRSWTFSGEVWTPNRPQYTANRDIITDNDGYIVVSPVTATEVSYLGGVTGDIQDQLNNKAPLESPSFIGTPVAPTANVDQNDTQLATTAFVLGQAASANPVSNGTAAPGTSTRYARADHVHPSDTSRAPTANPTFTGTVTVSASGIQFTDGPQTKQGTPSLTEIKPTISQNVNLNSLANALTYRDAIAAVGGAFSITIDADTVNGITFPIGTTLNFYQSVGAGGASIVQGAGVTLLATPGLLFRALNSSVSLTKVAANTWLVFGDLKS